MNHDEVNLLIEEYINDSIDVDTALEVEAHISGCTECSEYLYSLRILKDKLGILTEKINPESDLWPLIFAQINEAKKSGAETKPLMVRDVGTSKLKQQKKTKRRPLKSIIKKGINNGSTGKKKIAIASAVVLLAIIAVLVFYYIQSGADNWEVQAVSGIPTVNNEQVLTRADLEEGGIVNTANSQQTDIIIPDAGKITLYRNSVVKRVPGEENAVEYFTGKITVSISINQPGLRVKLPGAQISEADPGALFALSSNSEYTLAEGINSNVKITGGDKTVYLPADYKCKVYEGAGPLIPYFSNSGELFTGALERIAAGRGTEEDWMVISSGYGKYDVISLWHLFPLVPMDKRTELFGMIEKHVPPPTGSSQQGLLSLDQEMLMLWFKEITEQY